MDQPIPFSSERRRFPRIALGIQLEIRRDHNDVPIRVQSSDIGVGGCYVEMSITLEVGAEVDVVLWVNGERLTTKAMVTTCHAQFGNGFEFLSLSAEDQERLAVFGSSVETEDQQELRREN